VILVLFLKRLFLWTALREQSLAELVQKATVDVKGVKSFYESYSVLRQPELATRFIDMLYQLGEFQFHTQPCVLNCCVLSRFM
jgi:hypothetical protein